VWFAPRDRSLTARATRHERESHEGDALT